MPPTPSEASLTRRQGLIALALGGSALAIAACSSGTGTPSGSPSGTGSAAPSGAPADLASQVAAAESDLVARYDAALATLADAPESTIALLTSLRDQHAAHRDALGGANGSGSPASTGRTTINGLIDLERAAARDRIRACVEADDPELARLLSLIAASEASHLPALRDVTA